MFLFSASTLLGSEIPFQMQIDMLVNLQTAPGAARAIFWQQAELRFENFILDSVVKAEKGRGLSALGGATGQQLSAALAEQENSAEFVENLLRPRIYAYVANPVRFFKQCKKLFEMLNQNVCFGWNASI